MKQGRASVDNNDGRKVEPTPHAVTPARTNQWGESVAYQKDPNYVGRGFSAPKNVDQSSTNCGSQGKY